MCPGLSPACWPVKPSPAPASRGSSPGEQTDSEAHECTCEASRRDASKTGGLGQNDVRRRATRALGRGQQDWGAETQSGLGGLRPERPQSRIPRGRTSQFAQPFPAVSAGRAWEHCNSDPTLQRSEVEAPGGEGAPHRPQSWDPPPGLGQSASSWPTVSRDLEGSLSSSPGATWRRTSSVQPGPEGRHSWPLSSLSWMTTAGLSPAPHRVPARAPPCHQSVPGLSLEWLQGSFSCTNQILLEASVAPIPLRVA